jgi:hypothetical protein
MVISFAFLITVHFFKLVKIAVLCHARMQLSGIHKFDFAWIPA